jgi:hypothetical protein
VQPGRTQCLQCGYRWGPSPRPQGAQEHGAGLSGSANRQVFGCILFAGLATAAVLGFIGYQTRYIGPPIRSGDDIEYVIARIPNDVREPFRVVEGGFFGNTTTYYRMIVIREDKDGVSEGALPLSDNELAVFDVGTNKLLRVERRAGARSLPPSQHIFNHSFQRLLP